MVRVLSVAVLLCCAGSPAIAGPRASETARLRLSFGMAEVFGGCEGRPSLFSGINTLHEPAFSVWSVGVWSVGVGNAAAAHSVGTGRKVHDPCAGWVEGDPDFEHTVTEETWYDLEVSAEAEPGLARILMSGVDLHVATLDAGVTDDSYWEVPVPSFGFHFVTSTVIDPLLPDPGIYAPAYAEGSLQLVMRAVPRFHDFHDIYELTFSGATGSFPDFVSDLSTGAGTKMQTYEASDIWDVYVTLRLEAGAYAAVPEPASWAMLIVGFGLVGRAARRRGQSFPPGRPAERRRCPAD